MKHWTAGYEVRYWVLSCKSTGVDIEHTISKYGKMDFTDEFQRIWIIKLFISNYARCENGIMTESDDFDDFVWPSCMLDQIREHG